MAAGKNCPAPGRLLVSVVIPCHDYARFLPQCLNSLLVQDIDPLKLEVVFVDDESSDGSLDTARALLSRMPFGAWRTLGLARMGRPGPVRNAGLALAQGEHLLCLDPDDQLLPGYLTSCLRALADADVAYTGYFVDTGGQRLEITPPDYSPLLLANQNFMHAASLMRRAVYDRGARYRSVTGYEDWDFWVQAALLGARFVRVTGALVTYQMHGLGYFQTVFQQDGVNKAQIVVDNPGFFPSWTRAWARALLRGEPWAEGYSRGLIPVLRGQVRLDRQVGAAQNPGPGCGNQLPCGPMDTTPDEPADR